MKRLTLLLLSLSLLTLSCSNDGFYSDSKNTKITEIKVSESNDHMSWYYAENGKVALFFLDSIGKYKIGDSIILTKK